MPGEAELDGFPQNAKGKARLLLPNGRQVGLDLVGPEFVDHAPDGEMLVGEIFRSKDLIGRGVFEKKCRSSCLARNLC